MSERLTSSAVNEDTGHEYDGIRELDNNLPAWWLSTLWGAVAFAVVYWGYYETTGAGMTAAEVLAEEMQAAQDAAEARALELEKSGKAPWSSDEALLALTKDPTAMAHGKTAFINTCAACHKADGGGSIGPNLTDEAWIHGSKPLEHFKVVAEGVTTKGMPAWKGVLGVLQTAEVTAYVLSLRGTNVPGGKAPQGEGAAAKAPAGE